MYEQSTSKDAYRGKRVCVTGGAGFIGSHLCEALLERGAIVSVIDDLSNGLRANLERLESQNTQRAQRTNVMIGGAGFQLEHGQNARGALADAPRVPVAIPIRFVEGSLLDESKLAEAMSGAEIVFHQAAIASVPRSVKEPRLYFEVNARGTLEVLEAARMMSVKRIVYAASSSVYGDAAELPKRETMQPLPLSPYASAKFAGEHFLRSYCHCYGLSGVSLRYFNIFGPRQRPDSPYAAVLPRFAEAMLKGKKPVIYGDGTQTRDFTFVANAVHANLLAGVCEKPLRGESINIACGESFGLMQLLQAVADHLGVKAECDFAPPRIGEVQHSLASIDAARELIAYEPIVKFEEGLRRTLEWFTSTIH